MTLAPWLVSAQTLKEMLGAPNPPVLLDVREQEEYNESHISGCILIPLGELQMRAEKELTKDTFMVIYCAHGVRSLQALMALKSLGFKNLKSLDGGIALWDPSS